MKTTKISYCKTCTAHIEKDSLSASEFETLKNCRCKKQKTLKNRVIYKTSTNNIHQKDKLLRRGILALPPFDDLKSKEVNEVLL